MKEKEEAHYVRRTQKDYSMSFKFQVVGEVERGELTIGGAANAPDNAHAGKKTQTEIPQKKQEQTNACS